MSFDWDLLRPVREITAQQRKVAEDIALEFLKSGNGAPYHEKNKELKGDRIVLSELEQLGYIRNYWNKYYPTFPSLYFLEPSIRDSYAAYLDVIMLAIESLFQARGFGKIEIQDLSLETKKLLTPERVWQIGQNSLREIHFDRAAIFLGNFKQTVTVDESHGALVSTLVPSHEFYDYKGLENAWRLEVKQSVPMFLRPLNPPQEAVAAPDKPNDKAHVVSDKGKKVFVIHGRDERLRAGLFDFLRALHLEPLEWNTVTSLTGKAAPYIGEILEAAFNHAQAAVVLLTPDDEVKLRTDLLHEDDTAVERTLMGQARPNVLFEAGMAFASHPKQTVLVQIGNVKPFSDVAGRHIVKMDNSFPKRQELAIKLRTAGCPVYMDGNDWHKSGDLKPPPVSTVVEAAEVSAKTGLGGSKPPISNIVSLKPLPTPRYVKPDDSDTWTDVGAGEDAVLGAIAVFRNEPIKGIPLKTIDGLTAQITFFDASGGELQRIHYGTWLDDAYNHTDLSLGDTRELLIAVDRSDAPHPFAIENTRRQAANYEETGSRERKLERRLYDVTVRLVGRAGSDGDVTDDFRFNLDLRGEFPILKREWSR